MSTGRVFAEWLKDLKEKKAFRHVDTVMEKTTGQILKSSCSFNENVLFFFFFKDLVLFGKEQDLLRVSNVYAGRLVTCHPTRY